MPFFLPSLLPFDVSHFFLFLSPLDLFVCLLRMRLVVAGGAVVAGRASALAPGWVTDDEW